MIGTAIRAAGNLYLLLYLVDAGLSLADVALRGGFDVLLLAGPRNVIAGSVMLATPPLLALLVATPLLPARLFVPLALSVLWLNSGALPLPRYVEDGTLMGLLCVAQVIFGAAAFGWVLRRNRLRSPWILRETWPRPGLSLRHSLGMTAGALLLVPALLLYVVLSYGMALERATGGFLSFGLDGVSLGDRRYVRDGREVRLVGMMHIGEGTAYRDLIESFVEESTVVLAEGVTDAAGLLEEGLALDPLADALGLEPQGAIEEYLADATDGGLPEWPVVRPADLDLADLSPVTVAWLRDLGATFAGDPGPLEILRRVADLSGEDTPWDTVWHDILDRRNEHLLSEIDRALTEYEHTIVPWGALHLRYIEEAIEDRGFERATSRHHPLIAWRTMLEALR